MAVIDGVYLLLMFSTPILMKVAKSYGRPVVGIFVGAAAVAGLVGLLAYLLFGAPSSSVAGVSVILGACGAVVIPRVLDKALCAARLKAE